MKICINSTADTYAIAARRTYIYSSLVYYQHRVVSVIFSLAGENHSSITERHRIYKYV